MNKEVMILKKEYVDIKILSDIKFPITSSISNNHSDEEDQRKLNDINYERQVGFIEGYENVIK